MTSNHHAPYDLGYTRATMVSDKGKQTREGERIPQTASQFGLHSATRVHEAGIVESLVIADQHAAVNTFPGLVHTARHTMGVRNTRNQWPNPQGRELLKVGRMTGVKS